MKRIGLTIGALAALACTLPALGQEPPPVKLVIKPLLCVLDKTATTCSLTFDIRWTSKKPGEYCVGDSVNAQPLRCWQRSDAGNLQHERSFSEDFAFWLAPPTGGVRMSEVKIEILRVGSNDRRRERRTRHVWDVL